MQPTSTLSLSAVTAWLKQERRIKSAVLFGSSARPRDSERDHTAPFDLDLHLVASNPEALERIDWKRALPQSEFCMQCTRPATGGVRKVTAIFADGQIDLVVVPAIGMRLAAFGLRLGCHRRVRFLGLALNEMATCLHSGYSFLLGEKPWGAHYARVAALPGVRLDDRQLREMAAGFLCDLIWTLDKLARGEVVAAQHVLHTRLVDVNLRIWREWRRRRGLPLPSFGLGRGVERLGPLDEQRLLRVSSTADPDALREAALHCFQGLTTLLREMLPAWSPPNAYVRLVSRLSKEPPTPAR
jgi:predicted nucleotidyltransferase